MATAIICSFTESIQSISVDGKIYEFEMHTYCGPVRLNKRGDPHAYQPAAFLKAASLWLQQGRKIEDGLCVWHREPEPIVERRGGIDILVGYTEARKGE